MTARKSLWLAFAVAILFSVPLLQSQTRTDGGQGSAGGGAVGPGTTGTVPKFTGANAIGDSLYTDNGLSPSYNGVQIALISDIPQQQLQTSNALLAGCGVAYSGANLIFTVQACTYRIAGNQYTSAQTDVTLDAADPGDPRIDAIIVNDSGVATKITGAPAADPSKPTIDPTTQLDLTFATVAAGATTPSNVSTDDIYLENTEWTCSGSSGAYNCASTTTPYAGTKDVEVTAGAKNSYVNFAKGSTATLSNHNNLVFYIKSKATWSTQRSLVISFMLSGAVTGSSVTLNQGAFGFNTSITASYQQIVIPTSSFGTAASVDTLRMTIAGGGTSTIGYFLDNVSLQGGVPPPELPGDLMLWKGTYSATASYEVNDVVLYSNQLWIALLPNTASTPSTSNANWKILSTAKAPYGSSPAALIATKAAGADPTAGNLATWAAGGVLADGGVPGAGQIHSFGASFDGGGSALTAGKTVYTTVPFACTISAWNITADAGTTTVDVWRLPTGTAIPTVANVITGVGAGRPVLSAGTAIHSTNLTGWSSTAIAANDILGINLQAVATATYVNLIVECVQ